MKLYASIFMYNPGPFLEFIFSLSYKIKMSKKITNTRPKYSTIHLTEEQALKILVVENVCTAIKRKGKIVFPSCVFCKVCGAKKFDTQRII